MVRRQLQHYYYYMIIMTTLKSTKHLGWFILPESTEDVCIDV